MAICYLSIAQFLAMFLYSGGVLLMRKNKENIPGLIYFNVIVWVYVSLREVRSNAKWQISLILLLEYGSCESALYRKLLENRISNAILKFLR